MIKRLDRKFEDAFSRINRLQSLSLGKNPLICDCDSFWLIRILKYRYVNQAHNPLIPRFDAEYPTCSGHKNMSMFHVTESDLHCFPPKLTNISLIVLPSCRAQITCDFSKPIASIKWSVGQQLISNQVDYQLSQWSDKSFSLFVDNVTLLNDTVKCQAKDDHTAGQIFVANSICTTNFDVDDMNTVTISKFWLIIIITVALAVTVLSAICIVYVVKLYQEPSQVQELNTRAPYQLQESVFESTDLPNMPPPPQPLTASTIPRSFESANCDTNYQTVFYDYPCHRDFY